MKTIKISKQLRKKRIAMDLRKPRKIIKLTQRHIDQWAKNDPVLFGRGWIRTGSVPIRFMRLREFLSANYYLSRRLFRSFSIDQRGSVRPWEFAGVAPELISVSAITDLPTRCPGYEMAIAFPGRPTERWVWSLEPLEG